MKNFCTLFDKNYLFKGLAMYESLVRHTPDSIVWILCMDNTAYEFLSALKLEKAHLIKLSDIEDGELRKVKETRTAAEYCWTYSSALPLYLLEKHPELDSIAYVDADMYFYASLNPVYSEMGSGSIVIVPHRYTEALKHLEKESGTYNVGLIIFKNDANGLACLRWWKERCLEWCYARYEDGKFGDQLYLNSWPTMFKGVVISANKGVDAAPWNIAQYNLTKRGDSVFIDDDQLIFYHFQGLRIYEDRTFLVSTSDYVISKIAVSLIYQAYYEGLRSAMAKVTRIDPTFSFGLTQKPPLIIRIKKMVKNILTI